jgi:hypothetical protein
MIDHLRYLDAMIPETTQLSYMSIGVIFIFAAFLAMLFIKSRGQARFTWHESPQTGFDRSVMGCLVVVALLALAAAVAATMMQVVSLR